MLKPFILVSLVSLFVFAAEVNSDNLGYKKTNLTLSDGVVSIENWFFKGKIGDKGKNVAIRSKDYVIHSGEEFGVAYVYLSKNKKLKMIVELTVPEKPENFPCKSCKKEEVTISPDKTKVIVMKTINGHEGHKGFYWGVGEKDPRGSYRIKMIIEDQTVADYPFEVK